MAALKTVYDPEIPVDIYELGLIYKVDIDDDRQRRAIDMTLTAPGCPVAGDMPGWVENAVGAVAGVAGAKVIWCSIRHGIIAACRMKRALRSICGKVRTWPRQLQDPARK